MDRKNAWTTYSKEELDRLEQVNTEYKNCLDAGKTERECITLTVEKAKAEGYLDIKDIIKNGESVKTGDKIYAVCSAFCSGSIISSARLSLNGISSITPSLVPFCVSEKVSIFSVLRS